MADETRKFKYGDLELDTNQLAKYLHDNADGWLASQSYGNDSEGVRSSILDLIGRILSGDVDSLDYAGNLHSNTDFTNNSRDKHFLGIKTGKTADTNGAAAYYLDQALKAYKEKKDTSDEKTKFSNDLLHKAFLNKHTAGQELTDDNIEDLWYNLDSVGEDGLRSRDQRLAKMGEFLNEYANSEDLNNYDYTGSAFKDADTYRNALRNAATAAQSGNYDDFVKAYAAAGGNDFKHLFFQGEAEEKEKSKLLQTLEDYRKELEASGTRSKEAIDKLVEAKRQELEKAAQLEDLKATENIDWDEHFNTYNGVANGSYNLGTWDWEGDEYWRGRQGLDEGDSTPGWLSNNKGEVDRIWNTFTSTGNVSASDLKALRAMLYYDRKANPNDYTQLDGNKDEYIINQTVKDDGTAWKYNVNTRKLTKIKVGKNNTPTLKRILRERWAKQRYSNYEVPSNKLGGVLKAMSGAQLASLADLARTAAYNKTLQEEAAAKGMDVNQVKKGHAKAFSMESGNKDRGIKEGLDNSDWLRVASLAQDLTSIGASYGGPVGTAAAGVLGLTSTLTDLAADITDDSVSSGEVWSNGLTNLGFAAVGMLPGGAGKIGKLWRTAKKLAPVVLSAYGAYSLTTDPEVQKSFKKLMGSGSANQLTTNDWKNITRAVKTIAFAHNSAKGASQAFNGTLKNSRIPGSGALRRFGEAGSGKQFKYGNYRQVLGDKVGKVGNQWKYKLGDQEVLVNKLQLGEITSFLRKAQNEGKSAEEATKGLNNIFKSWMDLGKIVDTNGNAIGKVTTPGAKTFFELEPNGNNTKSINTYFENLIAGKGDGETVKVQFKNGKTTDMKVSDVKALQNSYLKTFEGSGLGAEDTINADLLGRAGENLGNTLKGLNLPGTYEVSAASEAYPTITIPEGYSPKGKITKWFNPLGMLKKPEAGEFVKGHGEMTPELNGFSLRDANGQFNYANKNAIINNNKARMNAIEETYNWVDKGPQGLAQNTLGRLNPLTWTKSGRQFMAHNLNNNWEVANGAGFLVNGDTVANMQEARRNKGFIDKVEQRDAFHKYRQSLTGKAEQLKALAETKQMLEIDKWIGENPDRARWFSRAEAKKGSPLDLNEKVNLVQERITREANVKDAWGKEMSNEAKVISEARRLFAKDLGKKDKSGNYIKSDEEVLQAIRSIENDYVAEGVSNKSDGNLLSILNDAVLKRDKAGNIVKDPTTGYAKRIRGGENVFKQMKQMHSTRNPELVSAASKEFGAEFDAMTPKQLARFIDFLSNNSFLNESTKDTSFAGNAKAFNLARLNKNGKYFLMPLDKISIEGKVPASTTKVRNLGYLNMKSFVDENGVSHRVGRYIPQKNRIIDAEGNVSYETVPLTPEQISGIHYNPATGKLNTTRARGVSKSDELMNKQLNDKIAESVRNAEITPEEASAIDAALASNKKYVKAGTIIEQKAHETALIEKTKEIKDSKAYKAKKTPAKKKEYLKLELDKFKTDPNYTKLVKAFESAIKRQEKLKGIEETNVRNSRVVDLASLKARDANGAFTNKDTARMLAEIFNEWKQRFGLPSNLKIHEVYQKPNGDYFFYKNGGALKELKIPSANKGTNTQDWFNLRYTQQNLLGWTPELDASKAGDNLNTNPLHHQYGDLTGAYKSNQSYTSNSKLVGEDLNTYYNSNYQGKSLDDYVNGYNLDADKIRSRWLRTDINYNDTDAAQHNQNFKAMFANRSGNTSNEYDLGYSPSTEGTLGSTTWMRRMDQYENKFEDASDDEKKSRIHKIGDLGFVYKTENGNIAKVDDATLIRLGLKENPNGGLTDPNANSGNGSITRVGNFENKKPLGGALANLKKFPGLDPNLAQIPLGLAANLRKLNNALSKRVSLDTYTPVTRTISGDFNTLLQQVGQANKIENAAIRMASNISNSNNAMAAALEGMDKSTAAKALAYSLYNNGIKDSEEKAWLQNKENSQMFDKNRNEGSMRLTQMFNHNKDIKSAADPYDNVWKPAIMDYSYKWQAHKADLKNNAVKLAQLKYQDGYDKIVNQYKTRYYDAANDTERANILREMNRDLDSWKIGEGRKLRNELYRAMGINIVDEDTKLPYTFNLISAKNGGKLKALKTGDKIKDDGPVKTRTKDADRFLKAVKHAADSHDKKLARLAVATLAELKRTMGK